MRYKFLSMDAISSRNSDLGFPRNLGHASTKKFGCRKNSGFTLVELVLVAFLVGVIASFAFPYLEGAIDDSRYMECQSNLEAIRRAKSLYVVDHLGQGSPTNQAMRDVFDCYFVHPISKYCPRVTQSPASAYIAPYDIYQVASCPFCSIPANIPDGVSEYVPQP